MSKGILGTDFARKSIIGDPLYRYIPVTRSPIAGVITEQDILAHPWLQRLRDIRQLQNAYLVFPAAEHSRYVHSLGAMHLAGKWADHLYPSLSAQFPTPSRSLVVETLRMAGLLHDVGHGPLAHLYDLRVLSALNLDHEDISRSIIRADLSPLISSLRSSPDEDFAPNEAIDPEWISYLICERTEVTATPPMWVRVMREIMCGPVSADNLDYLPRDSHQLGLGFSVETERIIYYSLIGREGLAFHSNAAADLSGFLHSRIRLYQDVYYHSTLRAIDLQVAEIFASTIAILCPFQPSLDLHCYMSLTDHLVLESAKAWARDASSPHHDLGVAWQNILSKKNLYFLAFEFHTEAAEVDLVKLEHELRSKLSNPNLEFKLDIASKTARSLSPLSTDASIRIYDANSQTFNSTGFVTLFRQLPMQITMVRGYVQDKALAQPLALAAQGLDISV